MHKQRHELSEWRQNNPDAHKPSYVKKPHVPNRSMRSKQISTSYPQLHGTHTPMHIQQMSSPCWTGKETCNTRGIISIGLF